MKWLAVAATLWMLLPGCLVVLLAGAVLVAGIYSYTGSLSPTVEESAI